MRNNPDILIEFEMLMENLLKTNKLKQYFKDIFTTQEQFIKIPKKIKKSHS